MAIVKLKRSCVDKANMEKVSELLGRFYSPNPDYSKGYASRNELTGGSAAADFQTKQVKQLLKELPSVETGQKEEDKKKVAIY